MTRGHYFQKKTTNLHTVAFYNLENLFDTTDDPNTLDNDFLPYGENNWSEKKYHKKLMKLGMAISNIGADKTGKAPVLVGVAEVENQYVLEDLINTKYLKHRGYDFVHYDSPDERGIDVALLYQKEHFEVLETQTYPLYVYNEEGERDYTRDILYVFGKMNQEHIHILVNHWPSRRDGATETAYKRIEAAKRNREIISTITTKVPEAKILIMGDFNDDPHNESIRQYLVADDLHNPMEKLLTRHRGSLSYRREWNLFDQIMLSYNFHRYAKDTHTFSSADIFDRDFLKIYKGHYKGNPYRTFAGSKYLGGVSDHFPVYVVLKWNI